MAEQETVVFSDAEGLAWVYLCALKMALKLHEKGIKMTAKAPSPYRVAQSYGYTGTRAQIREQVYSDVENHRLPPTLLAAVKGRRGET